MDQVLLLLMKSIEVLVAVSPIRIRGRIKVRVFLTHNVTEVVVVVVEAVAVVVELVGGDHSLVTDLTSETEISMRLKVRHFFRNHSRFFSEIQSRPEKFSSDIFSVIHFFDSRVVFRETSRPSLRRSEKKATSKICKYLKLEEIFEMLELETFIKSVRFHTFLQIIEYLLFLPSSF